MPARTLRASRAERRQVEPLLPVGQESAALIHAITPGVLLGLCQALFDQSQIPGRSRFPARISPSARGFPGLADRGMKQALGMIDTLLARAVAPNLVPPRVSRRPSPQAPLALQDSDHEHPHYPG